jgi:hypothetical protein
MSIPPSNLKAILRQIESSFHDPADVAARNIDLAS